MATGPRCRTGTGGGGGTVEVEGWDGSGRFRVARADERDGRWSDHGMKLTGIVEEVDRS